MFSDKAGAYPSETPFGCSTLVALSKHYELFLSVASGGSIRPFKIRLMSRYEISPHLLKDKSRQLHLFRVVLLPRGVDHLTLGFVAAAAQFRGRRFHSGKKLAPIFSSTKPKPSFRL
jgi:hypothetical protein